MELNLLTAAIATSTLTSMFYYWATAKNRWLTTAYSVTVLNGVLLTWINWALSSRGRVPEISFGGVEWTSDTSATNFFTLLCIWMIFSGLRGLWRLKKEAM